MGKLERDAVAHVGKRFKKGRNLRQLSQLHASKAANIPLQEIIELEAGESDFLPTHYVVRLARAIECDVGYLFHTPIANANRRYAKEIRADGKIYRNKAEAEEDVYILTSAKAKEP